MFTTQGGIQELPDATPPGATQLELVPFNAKLFSVPLLLLFPFASIKLTMEGFAAPAVP